MDPAQFALQQAQLAAGIPGVPVGVAPAQMAQMVPPASQPRFPVEAQQLLKQAQEAGEDDLEDDDDGSTRRRGRPRGSKTLNAYITNDGERRKYFVKRIKAIRSQAETFARCTGGNILVIA